MSTEIRMEAATPSACRCARATARANTLPTKRGTTTEVAANEGEDAGRTYLGDDDEELPPYPVNAGMHKEMESLRRCGVFTETTTNAEK